MDITPIRCGAIAIKKSHLLENRLLIGIDHGPSLTKVIFLSKEHSKQHSNEQVEWLTLTYALFHSADFELAIKWTRENAHIHDGTRYPVHVTGDLELCRKEMVERILGLNVEKVEETLGIIAGHVIALREIGLEHLRAPPVEILNYGTIKSEFIDQITKGLSSKMSRNDSSLLFPCLIQVNDSDSEFYFIDKDGSGELISWPMTGEASFLGLAKCLLDTNSFEEISNMGSTGERVNIDTLVQDIMPEDIVSPYGSFPRDMPVFPFGKCGDTNKGLDNYAKEDVAISLVAFFSHLIVSDCVRVCQMKEISRVYLSGNLCQSVLFQREMRTWLSILNINLELEILNFEHFGALGAMFCSNEDKEKYFKNL